MKRHFNLHEFFRQTNSIVTPDRVQFRFEPTIIDKVLWWMDTLSPIREMLGFPIMITDAVRLGEGTSQHYYENKDSVKGAVDMRPLRTWDENYDDQVMQLGLVLAAHPQITRVCYYTPSDRFTYGGFHCDCKTEDKRLFVNHGEEINWQRVKPYEFVDNMTFDKS